MQVIKHLRGFHKKISANYYYLNARRKDLAKQMQVTRELPRNNMFISVAFRMPLNKIPAVSECLVEAGCLPVPWHLLQSPSRSYKLVFLPQCLFGNATVAFDSGSQK